MAKIIDIQNNIPALVIQARNQDRKAQHKLYLHFASQMLSICRWYIHDAQFAEDVMLKGFFKALTSLDSYAEEGNFGAWLKTIMHRECVSFLRSKTHKLQYVSLQKELDSETEEGVEELDNYQLQSLIDQLPDGCKSVLLLHAMHELTHQEIAAELGISVGTSKSQVAYAKKLIREKLHKKEQNVY